jgi:hypothetical protein
MKSPKTNIQTKNGPGDVCSKGEGFSKAQLGRSELACKVPPDTSVDGLVGLESGAERGAVTGWEPGEPLTVEESSGLPVMVAASSEKLTAACGHEALAPKEAFTEAL